MTYADQEFIPMEGQEEAPTYPTAFGITFTPKVSGVVVAVLGLAGAVYLALNVLQPTWEQYQTLNVERDTKRDQIQEPEEIQRQIQQKKVELAQARQQNRRVLSLFATEQAMNTLLLDLNNFVREREGTLVSFQPVSPPQQETNVVTDGSLGAAVDGKLKRNSINVELEGSFDQIQSILRSFERLQTLLIVKDFNAEVSRPQALLIDDRGNVQPGLVDGDQLIPGAKPTLKATFRLDALMPLSEEEAQAAAEADQPAQ